MRVLFITPGNAVHETSLFVGLKQQGVNVHVITGKRAEPDFTLLQNAGIPVCEIKFKHRFSAKAIQQIRRILKAQPFDIVHTFNNATLSNALLATRNYPAKIVAYRGIVGNVSFLSPASWTTYLHPRVDRIICVAEAIRKYLLDLNFLGLRIAQKKPVTIYKGHRMDWYQKPPHDLTEFGLQETDFVVGCTANFRPRKGIDLLIRATAYFPENSNIHLLLIGKMDNLKLRKLIEASPNPQRIHLTGFRSNAPEILAACDACILPAIKREGLPKSIIEGMAYAVPPIVTDSGGSPELIEHGSSGLIIPSGSIKAIADAILQLYNNPELRKNMGLAAQERIRKDFTAEATIEKTYALYRELLQGKTPATLDNSSPSGH